MQNDIQKNIQNDTENNMANNIINNSHDENCIFCKIIKGSIPANIIYENVDFIAFHDINPAMRVHFLIIPKQHIAKLSDVATLDEQTQNKISRMFLLAPIIAKQVGLEDFKLALHNGKNAGQEVFHLHLHVMGK